MAHAAKCIIFVRLIVLSEHPERLIKNRNQMATSLRFTVGRSFYVEIYSPFWREVLLMEAGSLVE